MSVVMKSLESGKDDLKNEIGFEEGEFLSRHVGPRNDDIDEMLRMLSLVSLDELTEKTVPRSIRLKGSLELSRPQTERQMLQTLRGIAAKNSVFHSLIGMGYSGTITPGVIQRNILENPGWYTQYTPYQAEISQGRLEALINFQTMVCDLTAMELANASLLDEATAAAEAMMLCARVHGSEERTKFYVLDSVHPQTIDVVKTRAEALSIEVEVGTKEAFVPDKKYVGVLVQYPTTDGALVDYREFAKILNAKEILVIVAADILSLTMLTPPGEWGADVVVGNTQRFGVPFGFGGPHAAFFATKKEFQRFMPGRLVGVSKDATGRLAYRLSLQTREQHIKRERATSNICTAQVLLAVIASMYAVYHGPKGLKRIGQAVHRKTVILSEGLKKLGFTIRYAAFFDTIRVEVKGDKEAIKKRALGRKINLREFEDESLGISLDEVTDEFLLEELLLSFSGKDKLPFSLSELLTSTSAVPGAFQRKSQYLTHPVFSRYHSETELLRYMRRLESKDLSLTSSMIPLGSCTMKLNASAEMYPITWPEFSNIHPFSPADQTRGYQELTDELEAMLCELTGFKGVSLQPNAGSQGEYAGLLVIRAYHRKNKQAHRNICLIPASAHGTNPATASMVGMEVVVVSCDANGNVDVSDLKRKAEEHKANLSCLMITYPSTHGVFEEAIAEICSVIHQHGGQVYMDGANFNAQVGLCRPGDFGADVCHLNLHKTFCIPHGGGGPGVGPIGVAAHLVEFLPGHFTNRVGGASAIGPVCSAAWGSAGILPIPWAYIKMMGADGLKRATEVAILNANYLAKRLEQYYPILYRGQNGFVAHECILDIRAIKKRAGVDEIDIAKRLMDYGFHAPTVSFPVVGTLMVEPTESESKEELDRFCEAMISIYGEIQEIEEGEASREDNVLKNAPHTASVVISEAWDRSYSREKAAFPVKSLHEFKFWPSVSRIDNAYGDRNLFCSCVPIGE